MKTVLKPYKDKFLVKKNDMGIRGLFTVSDIPKDHVIIKIPKKNTLSSHVAEKCDYIHMLKTETNMSRNGRMAVWLLLEKFPSFEEYMSTLPKSFEWEITPKDVVGTCFGQSAPGITSIHFFNHYYAKMKRECDELLWGWNNIPKIKNKYKDFPQLKRDFLHMRKIITSRGFGHSSGQIALVPVLDLMNHSTAHNIIWKTTVNDFVAIARQDVKAGEELFGSYGNKHYFSDFLNYGIVERISAVPIYHNGKLFNVQKPRLYPECKAKIKQYVKTYPSIIKKCKNRVFKKLLEEELKVLTS